MQLKWVCANCFVVKRENCSNADHRSKMIWKRRKNSDFFYFCRFFLFLARSLFRLPVIFIYGILALIGFEVKNEIDCGLSLSHLFHCWERWHLQSVVRFVSFRLRTITIIHLILFFCLFALCAVCLMNRNSCRDLIFDSKWLNGPPQLMLPFWCQFLPQKQYTTTQFLVFLHNKFHMTYLVRPPKKIKHSSALRSV